jgi:preprotein translocase subunit SecG
MGADRFFWRLKMGVLEYVLGGVLIAMALFLVIAVLAQTGKDKKLSGSIAGGAETFFGKSKATQMDKILSRATIIAAIVFGVLVVAMYVIVSGVYGG